MSHHPVIAVIGAGNMGLCLISGLINNNYPIDKLWATDTENKKLLHITEKFGIHVTTDNAEAIAAAHVIILAVKPQVMPELLTQHAQQIVIKRPLIISIAAGIRTQNIADWLGEPLGIVRAMPNIAAIIGSGATALYANSSVNSQQHDLAESVLRSVGFVVWLQDEKLLDVVTSLSGSGPAYFFLIMEALQSAAKELGLPEDVAHLLTLQTAFGAAKMALESDLSLQELREHVTSPGGTTERALSVLEDHHIREIFKKALQAAKLRAEELAKS